MTETKVAFTKDIPLGLGSCPECNKKMLQMFRHEGRFRRYIQMKCECGFTAVELAKDLNSEGYYREVLESDNRYTCDECHGLETGILYLETEYGDYDEKRRYVVIGCSYCHLSAGRSMHYMSERVDDEVYTLSQCIREAQKNHRNLMKKVRDLQSRGSELLAYYYRREVRKEIEKKVVEMRHDTEEWIRNILKAYKHHECIYSHNALEQTKTFMLHFEKVLEERATFWLEEAYSRIKLKQLAEQQQQERARRMSMDLTE